MKSIIVSYTLSFLLVCNYSFAQNNKCEFKEGEYKLKELRNYIHSYYKKIDNEINCKKIINYYNCYSKFLTEYEKKKPIISFRNEENRKEINFNKLKKKKDISSKNIENIKEKYYKAVEDCKPPHIDTLHIPVDTSKTLTDVRKSSAFKLKKARQIIKSIKEGQYVKTEEIRQIGTDLYVDLAYFLKDEFPPGYHIFPDYSQKGLRELLLVFKDFLKENESKGIYESAIVVNITGYADSIPVGNDLKYKGFTEDVKDCKPIKENYYLLDDFNDTLPEYKDKSNIECGKNIKNNEELSLTRTIHPRNIIKEVLTLSEINLYTLPSPHGGGLYRRVEIQYLVPDYFLPEMEGVSDKDKKRFNEASKSEIEQNFKIFRLAKNKK